MRIVQAVFHYIVIAPLILSVTNCLTVVGSDDPLPWRLDVKVHPVSGESKRHTIHSYYLTNPESPDGSRTFLRVDHARRRAR